MNDNWHCIGDIHGQLDPLLHLLRTGGWIDSTGSWAAGERQLWFIGDFVDRGPDGIGVVDLVMRLQKQARNRGGHVGALLGNHDVLLLSAYHFGDHPAGGPGGTFRTDWGINGGLRSDMERLTPAHIEWMSTLPAMVQIGDTLLTHADSLLYHEYGDSIEEVNLAFTNLLHGRDPAHWNHMLEVFSDRLAFWEQPARLQPFLDQFQAQRLVHGHTPIQRMNGLPSEQVTEALIYVEGRCINVDGGMYLGGRGFLYET